MTNADFPKTELLLEYFTNTFSDLRFKTDPQAWLSLNISLLKFQPSDNKFQSDNWNWKFDQEQDLSSWSLVKARPGPTWV